MSHKQDILLLDFTLCFCLIPLNCPEELLKEKTVENEFLLETKTTVWLFEE